jgi:hypothetical protein
MIRRTVPFAVASALAAVGCASSVHLSEVRWEPVVVYQGDSAFERLKSGRPDAADPTLQIVGVDQGGDVVHVHYRGGEPKARVLYRHGTELTGLAIGDVDPSVPGEEIYAGGFSSGDGREGKGGAVVQIVMTPQGVATKRIFEGDAYVHSIETVEPRAPGEPRRLLVCTYSGEVNLLTPAAGEGLWGKRLLYKDPPSADPESPKIKDAAFLKPDGGGAPHEVLVVMKAGRAVLLDIDAPKKAHLVHEEPGGLSRVTPDDHGDAYVTGYSGRVLRFTRDGDGFDVDVLEHEGPDSGLRGVVMGRFPLPGVRSETAPLAIFGFHGFCRALVPRLGSWDAVTLYRDADRGHTILAADLVPGNDADELVISGYSRRITVLVARR